MCEFLLGDIKCHLKFVCKGICLRQGKIVCVIFISVYLRSYVAKNLYKLGKSYYQSLQLLFFVSTKIKLIECIVIFFLL